MSLTRKQISNFLDKNILFRFQIKDEFTINFNAYNTLFSFDEIEKVVKRNYTYWESLSDTTPNIIFQSWLEMCNVIGDLRNYFSELDSLDLSVISDFINSKLSYSVETRENNKTVYLLNIDSPIDEDIKFYEINSFINFYIKKDKYSLQPAIQNYIYIYKYPTNLGSYLNNSDQHFFYPALYLLHKDFSNTNDSISDFETNVIIPLTAKLNDLGKNADIQHGEITSFIERRYSEIDEQIANKTKEINDLKSSIEKWNQTKENNIIKLEKTYKEKLTLEAPEELWRERAEEHKKKAIVWTLILVVASILLIFTSSRFIIILHDYSKELIKESPFISKSFILISVISFFIYIIRVLVKIVLSNQHLATEYKQKAALTRFYQALIYAGTDIDKDERLIIMNALFSRVDTGLVKVDGSNDNDALLALLSKNIK